MHSRWPETAYAAAMDATDATPTKPDADAPVVRDGHERGQGMVEYALILTLISIVLILTIQVIGHQTNTMFSNVSNGLGH
jgi:Flp pilus assembly pilin Flp